MSETLHTLPFPFLTNSDVASCSCDLSAMGIPLPYGLELTGPSVSHVLSRNCVLGFLISYSFALIFHHVSQGFLAHCID